MLKLHQLSDISELQTICEKHEPIMLKLNWDLLKNRSPGSKEDFFYYEGSQLLAFIGVYRFGPNIEVCGMTHPEYRRRGLCKQLWQEAIDSGSLSGAHQILLNVPRASQSGQQWIRSLKTELHSVEYTLRLGNKVELLKQPATDTAVLRPFREEDTSLWARLDADAFDISEESTVAALNSSYRALSRVMHVIEYGGITAGKIEVDRQGKQSWIYGFAIDPALRGHGIGRSALRQVALREKENGNEVWLSVVADNARALHLYESCGFLHEDIQDYYEYQGIPPRPASS